MKKIMERLPIPLAGLMLGCAALGNLLQSYSEAIRYLFGGISFLLFLLLLLKLILFPATIKEELKNPITMSVSATFPMGMMLLSVYAKPWLGSVSTAIWFIAIALHIIMIGIFTYRFLRKLDIKKVFASWFIVYVGIAVAGITAPAYGMHALGTITFWFGLVSLLGLLILVGYRYRKYSAIPEPAQPLFCIFAAPASLCLAAYIQSVQNKSVLLAATLAVLASALYLLSLIRLPSFLRLPFYPSYAAFTFPFVISAIAMKQLHAYLTGAGYSLPFLSPVILIETIIAVLLVCYVLVRFTAFLLQPAPAKASVADSAK